MSLQSISAKDNGSNDLTHGLTKVPKHPEAPPTPGAGAAFALVRWLNPSAWRQAPQHFLYFFPLPQEHGSLRPGVASLRRVSTFGPMVFHSSRRS